MKIFSHNYIFGFLAALLILWLLGSVLVLGIYAQEDACTVFTTSTLSKTAIACTRLGRDEICNGSGQVEAQARNSSASFLFSRPGNIVRAAEIANLSSKALDLSRLEWGVSLAQIQASLPDDSSENITILFLGDIQLENLGVDIVDVPLIASAASNVRVRASTDANIITSLVAGNEVIATGILVNAQGEEWIRVNVDVGVNRFGWVHGNLLEGDRSQLVKVETSDRAAFNPLQAFNFISGDELSNCGTLSSGTVLIQTATNSTPINFFINSVNMQSDGTILLQANLNHGMQVTVFEGVVRVRSGGFRRIVPAGSQVSIPLNNI
jgi:hypothetical protein